MTEQQERPVPDFLKGVKVTRKERERIEHHNSNWNKLYQTLLAGDRDPGEMLKIMRVEFYRQSPRAGMLDRLAGKYIYNRRRVMAEQITNTLEELKNE